LRKPADPRDDRNSPRRHSTYQRRRPITDGGRRNTKVPAARGITAHTRRSDPSNRGGCIVATHSRQHRQEGSCSDCGRPRTNACYSQTTDREGLSPESLRRQVPLFGLPTLSFRQCITTGEEAEITCAPSTIKARCWFADRRQRAGRGKEDRKGKAVNDRL